MQIGQIVCSISGRDVGKYFVVIDTNDNFVYICDGKLHRLEKPKKKKFKHIKATNEVDFDLQKKLTSKENVSNKELRKILSSFKNNKGILK